ncbi:hypothetical protein CDAR_104261 [Caerostris darwini]|uniref:Secreted protein n=1 Tax=Caerostris darwini TaxID=1538125 RepID=A0AAV4PQZ6_9ARAC|nr:hypothetical protein CDAR_104261 [Caerostris darwini]
MLPNKVGKSFVWGIFFGLCPAATLTATKEDQVFLFSSLIRRRRDVQNGLRGNFLLPSWLRLIVSVGGNERWRVTESGRKKKTSKGVSRRFISMKMSTF